VEAPGFSPVTFKTQKRALALVEKFGCNRIDIERKQAMEGLWYTSPVFVVPVIWILFLSGILWASQPWTWGRGHAVHSEEVGGHKTH
jgi:hypothetical protein